MAMGPPWEGHGIAGQRQTCVLWQTGPGTPCRGCSPPARAVLTVSRGSRLSCQAQDPEHGELRHLCSASVKLVTPVGITSELGGKQPTSGSVSLSESQPRHFISQINQRHRQKGLDTCIQCTWRTQRPATQRGGGNLGLRQRRRGLGLWWGVRAWGGHWDGMVNKACLHGFAVQIEVQPLQR